MIQVSHVLADLIHALYTPAGAVMAVSSLIYFEYATIKSISKDTRIISSYAKNRRLMKNTFNNSPQPKTSPLITAKELFKDVINRRREVFGIDVRDNRFFAFATYHKRKNEITDI